MFWLALFCFANPSGWQVDGALFSNQGAWPSGLISVDRTGEALVITDRKHSLWLLQADRAVVSFHLDDLQINRVALGEHLIYVNGRISDTQDNVLAALDRSTGEMVAHLPAAVFHNMVVGEGRVVTIFFEKQGKPMIQVRDTVTLAVRRTFFKPTPEILASIDFPALWPVHKNGSYVVMSQVSNRIYFATPTRMQWEYDHSNVLPNPYPYKELDLGLPFVAPTRQDMHYPFALNQTKGWTEFYRKWQSQSKVTYFGALGDGYVVCFEIPDKVDSFYVGNHLGIRFFDKHFEPLGSVRERFAQIAGTAAGALYVLYPNGAEPHPGLPGSKADHYGIDSVNSLTALYKHWQGYRQQENRTYRIVVEAIRPDLSHNAIE